MRAHSIGGVAALSFLAGADLAACSRHTATVLDAPSAETRSGPVTRADVERDLSLEMVRGKGPVELGHEADIKVMLVNRSPSRFYPIVLSSDGSGEPGWREPHVWYTVEARTASGAWRPAEYTAKRFCGNFDENWDKDIVELKPGQSVELPWFTFYPAFWNLDDARAIRVVAHYSYGERVKDTRTVSPPLLGMPSYVLVSRALELPLDEPIVLELRVLGPIPRGPKRPLERVFDVVAVNQWKDPLPFSTLEAGGADLCFLMDYEGAPGRDERFCFPTTPGGSHEARDRIARGERRAVVTNSTRTGESWELSAKTRVRRVRAVLSVHEYSSARSAYSPWVDVPTR